MASRPMKPAPRLGALAGLYRRFGPHLKDQQGRLLAAAGCVVGVTAMAFSATVGGSRSGVLIAV